MSRITFAVAFLAVLSFASLNAQTRDADSSANPRDEAYWDRFESEFDKFINRAVDGFREPDSFDAPPDSVRFASADSADYAEGWTEERGHGRWRWSWSSEGRSAKFAKFGIPRHVSWVDERTKPSDVLVRYNRVEGLFLGLGAEKRYYWDGGRWASPYGSVGYALRAHRWWADVGVARQLAIGGERDRMLEFGVEGYVMPDSKDSWMIDQKENSSAAFFVHEDFRDHYERRGATIHGAYYIRGRHSFAEASLAYRIERHESMEDRTDWALFGGKKAFRANPSIDNGRLRSVLARAGYSSVTGTDRDGWDVHGSAEFGGRAFGGELIFQQYVVDVRRYQPLGEYDKVNFRVRAGTGHGNLPRQRSFELGGLGSLPGYAFKEFPGDSLGSNRMLLVNAEYMINGDVLHELDWWPGFMEHISLLFIADAGVVRRMDAGWSPLAGFGGLAWNEWKSDVGVGLSGRDGTWRIGAAWRTDRAEQARFFLRIAAPF